MNQVVAKWDKAYTFSDEELAAFIDLQELINNPSSSKHGKEQNTAELPKGGLATYTQWADSCTGAAPLQENCEEESSEFKDLADQVKEIKLLEASIDSLLSSTKHLKEHHAEVKSKSLVMENLWEGLLKQQSMFEKFALMVEERLSLYSQFGRLEVELKVTDPMVDPLKPGFQAALQTAIHNAIEIAGKPEYKEAQVNTFRYKQLLGSAFGSFKILFDRKMTELNVHCRELDSPVNHAELTERYLAVAGELRPLLDALQDSASFDQQLGHMLHDCLSKYLATRYNLAKRSRSARTIEEGQSEDQAKKIVLGAIDMLEEEGRLFGEFFKTPHLHKRHYGYFCEQALVPVTERLRTQLDQTPHDQLTEFSNWLQTDDLKKASSSEFSDKLCDLALQYCKKKLEESSSTS